MADGFHRILALLRRRMPELCTAAAIALVWGAVEAREAALFRSAVDVSPDRTVTLLSTDW